MSPGMVRFLLWAGVILLVCYMFGINPVQTVSRLGNGVQTVHNSSVNGGHP